VEVAKYLPRKPWRQVRYVGGDSDRYIVQDGLKSSFSDDTNLAVLTWSLEMANALILLSQKPRRMTLGQAKR